MIPGTYREAFLGTYAMLELLLRRASYLLLVFPFYMTAAPTTSPNEDTDEMNSAVPAWGGKMVRSNGYDLYDCGDPRNITSKANKMLFFLGEMKPQLKKLIADAQQGTRSQHGFAAFFKSDHNIGKVVRTFEPLVEAYPIIVDEERVSRTVGHSRTPQPVLMCINEGDNQTATTMKACMTGSLTTPLIISPGKEVMAICPDFFNIRPYPKGAPACPKLEGGRFKHSDVLLMGGLYAYVVYALVTMYNRSLYESYYGSAHLRGMQYAVDLGVRDSVLNAASYGFYAGGKLLILHSSWQW